jgi:hypothetical protein
MLPWRALGARALPHCLPCRWPALGECCTHQAGVDSGQGAATSSSLRGQHVQMADSESEWLSELRMEGAVSRVADGHKPGGQSRG